MGDDDHLNAMGRWYKLVRTCDCGSNRLFTHWVKDDEGKPLFKVCDSCVERKTREHEDSKGPSPEKPSPPGI